MAKAQKIPTRVLGDFEVQGKKYKANQVVLFPSKQAESLHKAGQVDADPEAVEYAYSQHGEAIEHDAEVVEEAVETPA